MNYFLSELKFYNNIYYYNKTIYNHILFKTYNYYNHFFIKIKIESIVYKKSYFKLTTI